DDVRGRHADWGLTLAEAARPVVHTREKHAAWLQCVGREFPNLRAALRWLCEAREVERALRLANALWMYWVVRDEEAEGRPLIEAVLSLPGVGDYPATLAELQRGAAHFAVSQGDLTAARLHHESALAYYRGLDDPQELGTTLMWLGAVAGDQGDFAHALPWLEEALGLLRGAGNPQELGFALLLLGGTLHLQGDLSRARALLDESVAVCRRGGLTELLADQALARLGGVVEELGDDRQAAS